VNNVSWILLALAILALLVFAGYRISKHRRAAVNDTKAPQAPNDFKISYAPSDMEWSGSTSGTLPLKTLTYKQYECLEDARYGFKIVAVLPTARHLPQPHKTRAHGVKTVVSLVKHGFLSAAEDGTYVINDSGLNALAVCTVRY
jgi:hypothetical protein